MPSATKNVQLCAFTSWHIKYEYNRGNILKYARVNDVLIIIIDFFAYVFHRLFLSNSTTGNDYQGPLSGANAMLYLHLNSSSSS